MNWLYDLWFAGEGVKESTLVAHSILILGLVVALGLALGSLQIRGIGLGIAGVLFAGIGFGHFGLTIDHAVIGFLREFGLILFVYAIGVQVGPGFVASLKKEGLKLNLMAASIVILGAITTVIIAKIAGIEMPVAVGLYSGGVTNTPSLAAAQQALGQVGEVTTNIAAVKGDVSKLPGMGYAIAYPFGVVGIILTMLLSRLAFRVNVPKEVETLALQQQAEAPKLATLNLQVKNPNLDGMEVQALPILDDSNVVVSRVMHNGQVKVAEPATKVQQGDVLLTVGPPEELEKLRILVGDQADVDVREVESNVTAQKIVVTKNKVLGKRVDELDFARRFKVNITRIIRAGVQLTPRSGARLQFGDTVLAVGEPERIDEVTKELGNSVKKLDHPQIIPIFVGIALGVLLGSIPVQLPGMPAPVKLGLAGGPLVMAIVLSSWGKVGPLIWYLPSSAVTMMKELGIVIFLACVGLKAGDGFVASLMGGGWQWMLWAALITLLPLFVVALVARLVYKLNYATLCGLLAGSMTDPPALAFAGSATNSEYPSISYATVYPLVMLLRVVSAQIIVLFFVK
jgi:putative transport protein